MAKKIFFSLDNWFFHFGMAYKMQNQTNDDFYALIDVDNKSKIFFENQELVKFKNQWFIPELSFPIKKTPDMEYLLKFEEKYSINLWKIAYSDRIFYKYNIHHKFSANEILCLLEQKCKFYEKIFQQTKPDFLLMFLTVSYHQVLLYEMCKSLGIKILMLQPIKFGNRMTVATNSNKFDTDSNLEKISINQIKNFEELRSYLKKFDTFDQTNKLMKDSFDSKVFARYKSNFSFFIKFWENNYQKQYLNFGRTRKKIFSEKLLRSRQRKIRQLFLEKNSVKNLSKCKPYVFFPLHYEPERVLLIDAPYLDDQISVIQNIAKSLPVNYTLCVKEHFMMKTLGWRDVSFYQKILDLPNVILLNPSLSPETVITESDLVVTIAGTSGQEAAFYNVPSIVFTEQPYSLLSSVHTLKNINELPYAIKSSLKTKVDLNELIKYVNHVEINSFEIDWRNLSNNFAFRFGFKGPIMEAELNEKHLQKFLDENIKEFEILANEHIKKLKV